VAFVGGDNERMSDVGCASFRNALFIRYKRSFTNLCCKIMNGHARNMDLMTHARRNLSMGALRAFEIVHLCCRKIQGNLFSAIHFGGCVDEIRDGFNEDFDVISNGD